MNILIITPGVYPVPAIKGGAVENLIQMLIESEEVTRKHNITVYTVHEKEIEKETKKINCKFKYIYASKKSYKLQRIIRHIINRLPKIYIGNQYIHSVIKKIKKEKEKYDIIIVQNVPEYALCLKKIKGNAKIFLHLHNDFLNINTKNATRIKKEYDKILAISNYVKNRVSEIDSNENVEVLYNGIDTGRFNSENYDAKQLKNKYGFKKNDFIFMYVGRLVEEKGVKEMIEAFCELQDKSTKLLILGDKKNDTYYKALIEKSEKRKNDIIFKGYIDYNKIPEIFSFVDVGIIPSTWDEPFGLVVVEFLASGIPVIVSDKGAMKEIVNTESICGEIVNKDEKYIENLTNAMLYYLKLDKDKMKIRKENAVSNAKKFTKEKYAYNFLKLIEEDKK